jgi:hypothetical protein
VFLILFIEFVVGRKLLERPRADGNTPAEIANGNPGYGFSE